jgi:hypothetical protein
MRRLGYIRLDVLRRVLDDRKRNLNVRREIRRIGEALRSARRVEDAWVAVRMAGAALGASAIALHLPNDAANEPGDLSDGFDEAGPDVFRARYGLLPERPGDTHVELGWSDGRAGVDRDTEIAIELLCDHLSAALERVEDEVQAKPLAKVVNLTG